MELDPSAVDKYKTGKEHTDVNLDSKLMNPVIKLERLNLSELMPKEEPDVYLSGVIKIEENEEISTPQDFVSTTKKHKSISKSQSSKTALGRGINDHTNKSPSFVFPSYAIDELNDEIKYGVESEFQFSAREPEVDQDSVVVKVENSDRGNAPRSINKGYEEGGSFYSSTNVEVESAESTTPLETVHLSRQVSKSKKRNKKQRIEEDVIRKRVKEILPQNQRFPIGHYKCYACTQEFTLLTDWENHIVDYLAKRGCFPSERKKSLIIIEKLEANTAFNESDGIWSCLSCPFNAKSRHTLTVHTAKIHIEKEILFRCSICPYNYTSMSALREHLYMYHDPTFQLVQCFYCNIKKYDKSKLKSHILTHFNEKLVKCSFCDYTAITVGRIVKHMRMVHTGILHKVFKCSKCAYSTMYKKKLAQHVKLKHLTEDITYYCFYCSFKSNIKMALQDHIFTSHRSEVCERKVKCKRCHMMFFCKISWRSHFRSVHTMKCESFPCGFCGADFTAKSLMFAHCNKNHLNQSEFQCHDCKYLGPDIHSLSQHVHLKHIPFECAHCGLITKSKTALSSHIIHHHLPISLKFKCKSCKYVAKTKQRLKQHTNVKHCPNPVWFSCFHCGHKNKIKHKLSQHMQTKHRDILKKKRKSAS